MIATVVGDRVDLNKAQVRYKKGFHHSMRSGNADINVGNRVSLDVQDGKEKGKLGGHAERQFRVLERSTQTFVLQCGDLVETMNSDIVEWEAAPEGIDANSQVEELEATPEGLPAKPARVKAGWLRTWWMTDV